MKSQTSGLPPIMANQCLVSGLAKCTGVCQNRVESFCGNKFPLWPALTSASSFLQMTPGETAIS